MINVLDKGFVELQNHMGNDMSIVNAARVSFNRNETHQQIDDRDVKLIRYMLTNRHTSPFEHVTFSLMIKCPLFVRSQIMRHRTFSFNEISRRYTDEEIEFYIPNELRRQSSDNRQASTDELVTELFPDESVERSLTIMFDHDYHNYLWLLQMGVAREQARMVLPQSMYTSFYMTGNLHNFMHFLELRTHSGAQYETRLYAEAIESSIYPYVKNTLDVWKELHGEPKAS
jgi:thymidylate synthase (FAD)